jgi:hypothetical protein
MVSGVSAGLGHYGIDAVWVRIIFILLVLGQEQEFALHHPLDRCSHCRTTSEKLEMTE